MLTFRIDGANFESGLHQGVRIVPESGVKVDFNEFATDGATLGLWHLHDGGCLGEGSGLVDASGNGRNLVNNGAEPVEDGYMLVRGQGDYLDAAVTGQPPRNALTLECWVRQWQVPPATAAQIAYFWLDASNYVYLIAERRIGGGAISRISASGQGGGLAMSYLTWAGADVTALLEGDDPWHVALVLDGNALRLYVGGLQRDVTGTGRTLSGGDYTLRLGRYYSGWAGYDLSAVLDEVRLSASARYATAFTPARLLTGGTFTSPTFDGVRVQADWLDLVQDQSLPQGCAATWDVRAADQTDGFGNPQASWQSYTGQPQTLPDGRYFQWRASLATRPDRLASPTLHSAEAHASEAGYNLYRSAGPGPDCLDYCLPFATVGPRVTQVQTDALEPGSVHWFGIRPVDASGRESPLAQGEVRLELDASGARAAERPAGVLCLHARPLSGARAELAWLYRPGVGGVTPCEFRIFGDGGTGTIDYQSPLASVPYVAGQLRYIWTSEPLAGQGLHQLAVRSVTADGAWDEQPAVVLVSADAQAPAAVNALEAEAIP